MKSSLDPQTEMNHSSMLIPPVMPAQQTDAWMNTMSNHKQPEMAGTQKTWEGLEMKMLQTDEIGF